MWVDAVISDNPQAWNDGMSMAARVLRGAGRSQSAAVLKSLVRPIYPQSDEAAFDQVWPQYRAVTPRLAIARQVDSTVVLARPNLADVVGILSSQTMSLLAGRVRNRQLRYDGYDLELMQLRPAHLVVETAAFADCFGWQHALTLNDPSATAELAALVCKARAVGINCVLLHDSTDQRFPLASRITGLFHHFVADAEDVLAVLDQSALEA